MGGQREDLSIHRADENMRIVRGAGTQKMPWAKGIFPRDLSALCIDRVEHAADTADEDIAAAKAEPAVVDDRSDVALPEDVAAGCVGAVGVAFVAEREIDFAIVI